MDTRESLQVSFCDLCNASVPLQDLEQGAAVRHAGKTIGGCCLAALRGGPSAARPAGAPGADASGPGSRAPADSRALSVGVALLAAVASVALFLDYRIGQVETATGAELERLQQSVKAQADVVQDTSVKLDTLAARADIDRIEGNLSGVHAMGEAAGVRLRDVSVAIQSTSASLIGLQASVQRLEATKGHDTPALEALRREIQQQSAAIADLAARPRPAVSEAASESAPMAQPTPAESAPSGLPATIVHQIGRLADRDEGVRFEAVDELLRSKDARVLPSLLPLAKDPDTFVRRLVVEGLKDMPSKESVDALLVALADPEQIVRSSAWLSLKAMTKQDFPFDSNASREARQKAQARWQEWWEKSRDSFGG